MTKPFISKLNPKLFWDTDISKLEDIASRRLIIERVFSLGDVDEIRMVLQHYGDEAVADELTRVNYLDPKTLNFASKLLNFPQTSFKCYKRKQSHQAHWNNSKL